MLPILQTKVSSSPQSVFTVPSSFPTAGTSARIEVNGVEVAFSRTSATQVTLRTAARAGSLVNFFQTDTPTAAGLAWTGTLDFPSVGAQTGADLTCAVQGAELGDLVTIGLPIGLPFGLVFDAFVSAANVVTVRCTNVTAAAIDPAALTYRVRVAKA